MIPTFENTESVLVFNAGANVAYAERKDDAFFMITKTAAYVGPAVFEVWTAPQDAAAPVGVCQPDLTKETKMQFAASTCHGFAANAAGDLILTIAPHATPVIDGQFNGLRGSTLNIRVPQCPGDRYITLKPVGAAGNVIAHVVTNKHAR